MEKNLKKTLENLCPAVGKPILEDFLNRMDPEYFSLFPPEEIATHLKLSGGLNSDHRVRCTITPLKKGTFKIAIAGFDYFSEFSIFCGLITSYGLDIESGHIFTFSESDRTASSPDIQPDRRRNSRNKIIDLFQVSCLKGIRFDPAAQRKFEKDLEHLVLRLDQNQLPEARAEVNQRVVEHLSRTQVSFMGRIYPVKVKFNNRSSDRWTVMEIRSRNIPAFLFAFSNALSMQGVYIYKVRIESRGQTVYDQIYLSNARGNKLVGKKELEILKVATILTKQFTHFLGRAPNPAKGILYFDQLLGKVMEKGVASSVISFINKKTTLELLARLLGTSEFLWEDFLKMQFDDLLPILKNFKKEKLLIRRNILNQKIGKALMGAPSVEIQKKILNEFKDREMFRIDMKHLLASQRSLMAFSRALTELAEVTLEQAYTICYRHLTKQYGKPMLENNTLCPFAICGLGKFGGQEMGYASDIEILFVYGGEGKTRGAAQAPAITSQEFFERLGQEILNLIEAKREGIFHIDLRLRPYGSKGSLSNSLDYLKSYYSSHGGAVSFERQALTKLRRVAGDPALGHEVEALRDEYVYSGNPWDLDAARDLRRRQIDEQVKPGAVNVKLSPGGVIDIEYAVQYLQILHGHRYPELRSPSTLEAMERLCQAGFLTQKEALGLQKAYLFLRNLIDALRIVRGNARDLLLPEPASDDFKFLARRMGYTGPDWGREAQKLAAEIRRQMEFSRHFFASRFGEL